MLATSEPAKVIAALCGTLPAQVVNVTDTAEYNLGNGFVFIQNAEEHDETLLGLWPSHQRSEACALMLVNAQGLVKIESHHFKTRIYQPLNEIYVQLERASSRVNAPPYIGMLHDRFLAANELLAAG